MEGLGEGLDSESRDPTEGRAELGHLRAVEFETTCIVSSVAARREVEKGQIERSTTGFYW